MEPPRVPQREPYHQLQQQHPEGPRELHPVRPRPVVEVRRRCDGVDAPLPRPTAAGRVAFARRAGRSPGTLRFPGPGDKDPVGVVAARTTQGPETESPRQKSPGAGVSFKSRPNAGETLKKENTQCATDTPPPK